MSRYGLAVLVLSALLTACSSGQNDDALYQSQKQAIDKAKDVDRIMKEQSDAIREKTDNL